MNFVYPIDYPLTDDELKEWAQAMFRDIQERIFEYFDDDECLTFEEHAQLECVYVELWNEGDNSHYPITRINI